MDDRFYRERLYPFQDQVLRAVATAATGFYLSGGTAASRGYLEHRFSDDLDFFVNDEPTFALHVERVIHALTTSPAWQLRVLQRDERFARLLLADAELAMKVDLVNDVPAHVGMLREHPVLGRLDSPENILANKLTAALDRQEPKDLADIWGFCCLGGLSLQSALQAAGSKAAGIFEADLARLLCSVSRADYDVIRWANHPEFDRYRQDLSALGEALILGTVRPTVS